MTIEAVEVVRHFLKLEAKRSKYSDRKDELLSWCELPDAKVMQKARGFAEERDDVNPALVYTVGIRKDDRNRRVASWTRERIKCRAVFTSGISPHMRSDIDAVRGNVFAFAQGPASKYPEFLPLAALCEITSTVIVVAQRVPGKDGEYEAIDGVHRLVGFCRAGIEQVDAYVAHMK
jgi:hypothetical protein